MQGYGSEKQYLDAAGHWHALYQEAQIELEQVQTRSQRDLERLQTQNSELEHDVARLKAEKAASEAQVPKAGQKRKKVDLKDMPLKHKKLDTGKAVPAPVPPILPDLDAAHSDLRILEEADDTGKCCVRMDNSS